MCDRAWHSEARRLVAVPVPVPMPSIENSRPIASQFSLGEQSFGDECGVAGLAKFGWLVELRLAERPDPRFFAVGTLEIGDAEEAILRYPGMVREDKRTALRPLSGREIACLGLRMDAVRPYICTLVL